MSEHNDEDDVDFLIITRKKKNKKQSAELLPTDEAGTTLNLSTFELLIKQPTESDQIFHGINSDDLTTLHANVNILEVLYQDNPSATSSLTTTITTTTKTPAVGGSRQNIMDLRLEQAKNLQIQQQLLDHGIKTSADKVYDEFLASESARLRTTQQDQSSSSGLNMKFSSSDVLNEEQIKQQYLQQRGSNVDILTKLANGVQKTNSKLFLNEGAVDDDLNPKKLKGGIAEVSLGLTERVRASKATEEVIQSFHNDSTLPRDDKDQNRQRDRDYSKTTRKQFSGRQTDEKFFKHYLNQARK